MPANEILSLEQKPKNLLLEFKKRLSLRYEKVKKIDINSFGPENPKLYRRIEELSTPLLAQWIWIMSGSKHEEKNVKEVRKVMNI